MPDLTAFLLARITEDEADAEKANKAQPAPWRIHEDGDDCCVMHSGHEAIHDVAEMTSSGSHIARWDPAECQAKRAIVEWCGQHEMVQIRNFGNGGDAARACDFIPGGLSHPQDSVVLRFLAAPYVSHPDYDPAWATETVR